MVYRKGEKPAVKTWPEWDCGRHPVRQRINTGDPWFRAWYSQAATPWPLLAKMTRLTVTRFRELEHGAPPTGTEIEVLAKTWKVVPEQVIASLSHK